MSSDRVTITLCARVQALEGADPTAALAWHREHLGEPGELDHDADGNVEYFDTRAGDAERGDYELRPVEGGWLLRRFIARTGCYADIHINEALRLGELSGLASGLASKAGVPAFWVQLHTAVWYDGTDEPLAEGPTPTGEPAARGLRAAVIANRVTPSNPLTRENRQASFDANMARDRRWAEFQAACCRAVRAEVDRG